MVVLAQVNRLSEHLQALEKVEKILGGFLLKLVVCRLDLKIELSNIVFVESEWHLLFGGLVLLEMLDNQRWNLGRLLEPQDNVRSILE